MPSPPDGLVATDVDLAVVRLRAGGLVAIPTETVYGLGADAAQADAVARVFAVKGRPSDHPLIVHLAGPESLEGWVAARSDALDRLATACWPGPLTVLVERGPRVIDAVTGGRATVGLRVPSHPLTTELLRRFGGGVAAPSANRFGRVSPTRAEHVVRDLGDLLDPRRDLVLDGGACVVGVESTIVDLTTSPPQVLRAGAITGDEIARILTVPVIGASGPSRAAGMLAAHYAPSCRVVLAGDASAAARLADRSRAEGRAVRVLDRTADLVDAAHELYNDLRAADDDDLDDLVVVVPPPTGLGHALRDRLAKAATGTERPGSVPDEDTPDDAT